MRASKVICLIMIISALAFLFTGCENAAADKADEDKTQATTGSVVKKIVKATEPENAVTVEQAVEVFARALGFRVMDTEPGYQGAMATAAQKGLISEDDIFVNAPEAKITREEMAQLMIKAIELVEGEISEEQSMEFSLLVGDAHKVSSKYEIYVWKAYKYGLFTGEADGKFNPQNFISQEQLRALTGRMIDPTRRIMPSVSQMQEARNRARAVRGIYFNEDF